jgi:hypothetical protein
LGCVRHCAIHIAHEADASAINAILSEVNAIGYHDLIKYAIHDINVHPGIWVAGGVEKCMYESCWISVNEFLRGTKVRIGINKCAHHNRCARHIESSSILQ